MNCVNSYKISLVLLLLLFAGKASSQCPNGSTPPGKELVVNGDFSLGNIGILSEYEYETSLLYEGFYNVTDKPATVHSDFTGFDHTTGNGNFMVINGAPEPNVSVWCQSIKVTPNTYYVFSTWLTSVFPENKASLQFSINGKKLGTTFTAPDLYEWKQYNSNWFSGNDTVATICIVNQNTETKGNDFGLDDISFRACGCGLYVDAGKDKSICKGSPIKLQGKGGEQFRWKPSTGLSNDTIAEPIANPEKTTQYWLFSKGGNCTDSAKVIVTVFEPVEKKVALQKYTICKDESVQLSASGGPEITWFPVEGLDDPNTATPIAKPTQTTLYTVTISNGPCIDSAQILVEVNNTKAAFDVEDFGCGGYRFVNNSENATAYLWDFGDSTSSTEKEPSHKFSKNGDYKVTLLVNGNTNCAADTITEIVSYKKSEGELFIPNVLTANGDGANDIFRIKGLSECEDYSLYIYNRWGQEVHKEESNSPAWDGRTANNILLAEGIYYYMFVKPDKQILQGTITLLH